MKTIISLFTIILLVGPAGCKKQETASLPAYQTAINAKYSTLSWTLKPDNGGIPQPTTGKRGWVQYYGNHDRAIYYFPAEGSSAGGAFGMLNYEMLKYDKLGQDNFAYIASDPKEIVVKNATVHYNDIVKLADNAPGIVITNLAGGTFVVYGSIYQKYLSLNTWNGPLGFPTADEVDTKKQGGRYNYFSNKGATVVWSPIGGAQAYWGRIEDVYNIAGGSSGWLGFPTSGCDPAKADKDQTINFEGGLIIMQVETGIPVGFPVNGTCGTYQLYNGKAVDQTGKVLGPCPPNVICGLPCV